MKAWIVLCFGWMLPVVNAFAQTREILCHRQGQYVAASVAARYHNFYHTALPAIVVDSAMLAEGAAVAVASFAAGILTQVPRLQQLERNATATREEAQAQISSLEARLYALDQEFEQGTAALKEQFDELRLDQLKKQKRQQAQEFQYKLQAEIQALTETHERQLQEQRSMLLSEQLEAWKGAPADQQAELVQLRVQQRQLQDRNAKLTVLLEDAQTEMEELRRRDKRGFWGMLGN